VRSFSILTTAANPLMEPIHDRMPVILCETDEARWLDPGARPPELTALLRPCPAAELAIDPVNRALNRVTFEGPACLEPPER
jgi:putative SOS response-associated peptidase YedK